MSAITIEDDLVHYEVLGRGRPVILLHSWLGSWRYWVPAMQQLSMKYRTYALDLWGFGDSGRDTRRYDFRSQVKLLDQFMEKLGITKAALIGHGLGASISVRYALENSDRVPRLMTVSPPLFRMAPTTSPLTFNTPKPQLPAPVTPPAASTGPALPADPDKPGDTPPTNENKPGAPAADQKDAIYTEAETVPWRSDEIKARVRAALDRQTPQQADADAAKAPAKSPRDAATPPTDQPVKEIVSAATPPVPPPEPVPAAPTAPTAPPLPEKLDGVPALPKVPYTASGDVQRANPLKEHLGVLDRMELLKRHVDPGTDLDKLKVEVDKADSVALAMSIESFSEVDTLREMQALKMPTVMVYGVKDTFLPPPDGSMISSLNEGRTTFRAMALDDVRHFPMLEEKADFTRLMLAFLEAADVQQIDLKEVWVRRVR
jgi:pimeloyl-ACP methyl ester carboxylesterase